MAFAYHRNRPIEQGTVHYGWALLAVSIRKKALRICSRLVQSSKRLALPLCSLSQAVARNAIAGPSRTSSKLGLGLEIRFAGEVHNRAKRAFFEGINLLVVPSQTENFALVVAEALASGIPVIASRGTPWAALEEKGCGLWVDNSPAELAQAIMQMRDAPLMAMGARGREWMAADFSWSAAARSMCNTYSSLVYGKRLFDRDTAQTAADAGRAA